MTKQSVLTIWTVTLLSLSTLVAEVSHTDDDSSRLRHTSRVKRLIGGQSISDGQWPWLVNLRGHIPLNPGSFVLNYKDIYCGGVLIDKQWVMSAAHCFTVPGAPAGILTPSNWFVKAGTVNSNSGVKSIWDFSAPSQSIDIWTTAHGSKLFVHPNYSAPDEWANDMALLKLDAVLPLKPADPYIDIVALPISVRDYWPPPGVNCYMQGWGCTELGGPVQQYASSALLPIISKYNCTYYGDIGNNRICAGYNLQSTGICKGDSGGPLVCSNENIRTLAGIASFTSANDPGNYPGIFTRVSKYANWITNTIANN